MAGRIPQHFIDEVLAKSDIVELVNLRVPLKRQGKEYSACCPFHSEKTPSFTVSPNKQFYHCFGCGAHGSAISFLMEYENFSYVEAIESLADTLGLDVPRENSGTDQPAPDNRPIKAIHASLEKAAIYFQQQLRQHPVAIDYLKQREVSGEIARDFMLGYVPEGWDNLIRALTPTFNQKQLDDAGLISKNDSGRVYDKFRERIMFPIRNQRGQVIAFGGRVMSKGEPKYLNSPETAVFNKSQTLYGLYEARKANARLDHYIIVEGYMDVVALAQSGIGNCVATLGTATTPDHIRMMLRGGIHRLVFCFDGDRAGKDAAWRALNQAMGVIKDGQEVRFLFLPDGEDPDSWVRQYGKDAFLEAVEKATPLSSYFLSTLKEHHDFTSMEGRSSIMLEARKIMDGLDAELLKAQLEQKLGELTRIQKTTAAPKTPGKYSRKTDRRQEIQMTPMRMAVAACIQHPALLASLAPEDLLPLQDLPGGELLTELAQSVSTTPEITTAGLIERFRTTTYANAIDSLSTHTPPNLEENPWSSLLQDAMKQLHKQGRKQRLNNLLREAERTGLSREQKQELAALLTQ